MPLRAWDWLPYLAFPGCCDQQRPSQTARGKISDCPTSFMSS
jgi:hypothetical protein